MTWTKFNDGYLWSLDATGNEWVRAWMQMQCQCPNRCCQALAVLYAATW